VALSFMHGNSSGSTTSIRGKLPMFFRRMIGSGSSD
jgi:hypothetical protein